MPKGRPTYVLFAGVNGAGKSTFYRSGCWKTPDIPKRMVRVNPDEIARSLVGEVDGEREREMASGKQAVRLVEECLSSHRSFNRETTLTGRSVLKSIERARQEGFRVIVFFIGVSSADVAVDRVRHRVAVGGHDIAEVVIRRRFDESIANPGRIIDLCDEVWAFDNTQELRLVYAWRRGVAWWWGIGPSCGRWLLPHVQSESWRTGSFSQ